MFVFIPFQSAAFIQAFKPKYLTIILVIECALIQSVNTAMSLITPSFWLFAFASMPVTQPQSAYITESVCNLVLWINARYLLGAHLRQILATFRLLSFSFSFCSCQSPRQCQCVPWKRQLIQLNGKDTVVSIFVKCSNVVLNTFILFILNFQAYFFLFNAHVVIYRVI